MNAVESLSLKVPRGRIVGLPGRRGEGKTTPLRILTTKLMPTLEKTKCWGTMW